MRITQPPSRGMLRVMKNREGPERLAVGHTQPTQPPQPTPNPTWREGSVAFRAIALLCCVHIVRPWMLCLFLKDPLPGGSDSECQGAVLKTWRPTVATLRLREGNDRRLLC